MPCRSLDEPLIWNLAHPFSFARLWAPWGQTWMTQHIFLRRSTQAAEFVSLHSPLAAKFMDLMCILGLTSKHVTKCRQLISMWTSLFLWQTSWVLCRHWTSCHHIIFFAPWSRRSNTCRRLHALAEPIAMQMVELKQPIQARLAQTSTLKMTFLLGLGSFILSLLLHLLPMYLFHRYHSLHKFMPFTHLLKDKENETTQKNHLTTDLSCPPRTYFILTNWWIFSLAWQVLSSSSTHPAKAPHFSCRTAFLIPFLQR